MRKKSPDHNDVYAGNKLRTRRLMLGYSQEFVSQKVGLTFQQIQKYEKGANRMGASRLKQFADILKVPVSYFFSDEKTNGGVASDVEAMNDFTASKNGQAIMSAYAKLSPHAQQAMVTVIETLARG